MEIGQEWFKLYSGIIWDANVRKLTATQKWLYVTILCLANEEGYDAGEGTEKVRKLSRAASEPYHICTAAGSDLRTTRIGLEKLSEYSLIIVGEDYEVTIPNWYKFQEDREKHKKRKSRKKRVNIEEEGEEEGKDIIIEEKYGDWLNVWNEQGPGPKHNKLGENGIKWISKLTTEGAKDGIVWDLDMFTKAVTIYRQALAAHAFNYKYPSLVDLLSRTYNQLTGPGLTHFLPREGWDPYKDLGLQVKERL